MSGVWSRFTSPTPATKNEPNCSASGGVERADPLTGAPGVDVDLPARPAVGGERLARADDLVRDAVAVDVLGHPDARAELVAVGVAGQRTDERVGLPRVDVRVARAGVRVVRRGADEDVGPVVAVDVAGIETAHPNASPAWSPVKRWSSPPVRPETRSV